MKRFSLIILSIVVMLLASLSLTFAADVQLNGETFTTTSNGQLYTLTFYQGPFGPGETGDVVLSDLAGNNFNFSYQFDDPVCEIEALTFFLIKNQLKYIPADILADTLTFTKTSGGDE